MKARNKYVTEVESYSGAKCSCGKHQGLGDASPHERAQMYNWSRQRNRVEYNVEQRKYLESYEAAHGFLGAKEFLFNASRFKEKAMACLNGAPLPWK